MHKQKKNSIHSSSDIKQIGPYLVEKEIGAGGMGRVYKGHHHGLERSVAIKVLLSPQDASLQKRFLMEAKVMAQLKHPGIVTVYDFGAANVSGEKINYIVMDFILGTSLREFVGEHSLSVRQSLLLMEEITLIMAYAHENKIIHRDLKPGNILIEKKRKRPLITDFGLAKNISRNDNITQSGEILGTPRYMAPEQVLGQKTSLTTDVYALGAIFYELLAGVPAVSGDDHGVVMYKVVHSKTVPLCQHKPGLSKHLQNICQKTMAKEPKYRYANAGELAADIQKFLRGEVITATSKSLWLHSYRKPAMISTMVFITILSFLFLVMAQEYLQKKRFLKKHLQQVEKLLQQKHKTISSYMKVASVLEKVYEQVPNEQRLLNKLFQTYKEIGLRALRTQDYLLAYVAFKKCCRWKDEGHELLKLWEKQKKKQQKKQIQILKKIMTKVVYKKPSKELLHWYVTKVARNSGHHTLKYLLLYLKSSNFSQRQLTIRALGQLGNTTTKVDNKDVVMWLLDHLKNLDFKNNLEEAEEVIKTFGWLQDSRANRLVAKIRKQAKENSLFWHKTRLAYSRIPVDKSSIKTGQQLVDHAQMLLNKGNLAEALVCFKQLRRLNPDAAYVYSYLGIVYKKLGKHFKAISNLKKAIRLDSKYIHAYFNLGVILKELGNFNEALDNFNKVLNLNSKYAKAYLGRGQIYMLQKKYNKALFNYNQIIKLDPKYHRSYLNRGFIYKEQGDFKKAMSDFYKTLEFYNASFEAHFYLGEIFQKQGHLMKALTSYNQALRLNPQYLNAYIHRGGIFNQSGYPQKALSDYKQVLQLDPKFPEAYYGLGLVYGKLGKMVQAIGHFNKAIKLRSNYKLAYFDRAKAHQKQRNFTRALADYTKTMALDPKFAEVYLLRGYLYYSYKKFQNAHADWKILLRLSPSHPQAQKIRPFVKRYGK